MAIDPNDEPQGAIPDGQAPMGTDASDDAALESDSQLDGKAATGDEDGDGEQSGLDVIHSLLSYGRKKNGIGMGSEQAGNIPAVPAGPGGDKPQDNPFGTRTAPVKFGKRFAEGGPVEDDDLTTGAIPDGEEDNRYPEVNAVKGALNTQGQADANTAGAIADPEGISDAVSALKSGAQTGMDALNEKPTGEDPAQAAGAAVKGALNTQGQANANTAGAIADPEGVSDLAGSMGSGVARLMKYLTGDAAHGHEVAAAEKAADPAGELAPGDRRKAAIEAAAQQNPETGWRLLQRSRQEYEGMRHSAAAVLDGAGGKPGDPAQAANLATRAFDSLPDGSDVHFKATPSGVTATVINGSRVTTQVQMNPQQFRQFLTEPQAQFDQLLDQNSEGIGVVLQRLTKGNSAFTGAVGQPTNGGEATQAAAQRANQPSPAPEAAPAAPADGQQQNQEETPLAQNTLEQAERVAARIFPMVSQSAQRQAYVQKIMQEGGQKYPSEERQATSRQEGALNVAQVRANTSRDNNQNTNQTRRDINDRHYDSYDARTQSIAKQKLADMISKNQNATRGQALNLLGRAISSPGGMDPKQIAQAEKVAGVSIQQLMQQSQQPGVPDTPTGQPAAPASGQAPAGGQTRIINGVTYTKVQGGWKRVQQ